MSDPQALLVEQAHSCVQLVEDGQLSEALVVLRSLSKGLTQVPEACTDQASANTSQKIADLLVLALDGATSYREDSRVQLQKLRSVQQVKAVYSASSLPQ